MPLCARRPGNISRAGRCDNGVWLEQSDTVSLGPSKKKIIFSATYDASDPQTNKHASGIAKETLILATDASGVMKIVSQKEQTSKRKSGQSETSEDATFEAATADTASDAALKQMLLGYWTSGRHAVLVQIGRHLLHGRRSAYASLGYSAAMQ